MFGDAPPAPDVRDREGAMPAGPDRVDAAMMSFGTVARDVVLTVYRECGCPCGVPADDQLLTQWVTALRGTATGLALAERLDAVWSQHLRLHLAERNVN